MFFRTWFLQNDRSFRNLPLSRGWNCWCPAPFSSWFDLFQMAFLHLLLIHTDLDKKKKQLHFSSYIYIYISSILRKTPKPSSE